MNVTNMDKIPTAEDVIKQEWSKYPDNHIDINSVAGVTLLQKIINDCMIKFTKLHVKSALEAAAENAKVVMTDNCNDHTPFRGACVSCGRIDNPEIATEIVDKNSILNAYPENLIK